MIAYDSDEDALQNLPSEVKTYHGDVRDVERLEEVIRKEIFEVLINCAGIQRQGAIEDMGTEEFREHIEVNYLGSLKALKTALPMVKERDGKIINISSVAGVYAGPYLGAYSGSKHAVEGMTESLRMELKETSVDVVLIEPGPVETGFNEEGRKNLRKYVPGSVHSERYREKLEKDYSGIRPKKAGVKIVEVMEKSSPRPRYSITKRFHWLVKLRSFIPWRIREFLISRR